VAIVGGGVGGLALAATLDARRFEVTVAEAEPLRSSAGAALGLWPSARAALRGIGADVGLDDGGGVGQEPSRLSAMALHDGDGRRLLHLAGPDVALVRRATLLAALSAAVPPGVHRSSSEVTRPSDLDADLVVGADGVRSRVRGLVWARGAERVGTPFVAMRGIVPASDVGDIEYGEYWGSGALFGIAPLADGEAYWFSAHRSSSGPEPLDLEVVRAELHGRLGLLAGVVGRILDSAGRDTLVNRLWVAPPLPRYVHGRYVVIGDAAHASLPNLGRGACNAILDAVQLGDAVNAGVPLAVWQARRLPPTQAARAAAAGLMRLAVAHHGRAGRDGVLRRLGRPRG
jgi:2-polyprenyl-6-methoxyphenol hydroxylase-like FAD-dependent oxidoreductase